MDQRPAGGAGSAGWNTEKLKSMQTLNRVATRKCPTCLVQFTPRRSRVKFCSKKCKTLDQWGRRPEEATTKPLDKANCRHCGKYRSIRRRGLCSTCHSKNRIRDEYNATRPGRVPMTPMRPCPVCRFVFRPKSDKQIHCGHRCAGKARRIEHKSKLFTPSEINLLTLRFRGVVFKVIRKSNVRQFARNARCANDDLLQTGFIGLLDGLNKYGSTETHFRIDFVLWLYIYVFRHVWRHLKYEYTYKAYCIEKSVLESLCIEIPDTAGCT